MNKVLKRRSSNYNLLFTLFELFLLRWLNRNRRYIVILLLFSLGRLFPGLLLVIIHCAFYGGWRTISNFKYIYILLYLSVPFDIH